MFGWFMILGTAVMQKYSNPNPNPNPNPNLTLTLTLT